MKTPHPEPPRSGVSKDAESASAFRSVLPFLLAVQRYGTLAGFFGMILLFWVLLPETFMTSRNWLNITQQMSMLAVIAFAMTIVMTMGDFDLSVGSMASLAAIVAAVVFRETGNVPLGIALALLAGILGGVFNGFLVSTLRILPFVATLSTLTIFSGLAFIISGGTTIFGGAIPSSFSGIAKGGLPLWMEGEQRLLLPSLTILAALVMFISWFALERMVFGRHLSAIGGNREAARLAGVPVERLRIVAFGLTGLGAALGGLMVASRVASANPTQGSGLMLDAIAAVFLGMTISERGEPRIFYTLVGVLILGILGNGLTQLSIDSYIRDVLVGIIILVAVASGSLIKRRP